MGDAIAMETLQDALIRAPFLLMRIADRRVPLDERSIAIRQCFRLFEGLRHPSLLHFRASPSDFYFYRNARAKGRVRV